MYRTYNELKDLKVGDVFTEEHQYSRKVFVVISEPKEKQIQIFDDKKNFLSWEARIQTTPVDFEIVNFVVTEGLEHYGPRILKN